MVNKGYTGTRDIQYSEPEFVIGAVVIKIGSCENAIQGGGYDLTSYPPSLTVTVTSTGWLTTPTTDLTNEMKRSGNQMIDRKSVV